MIKTIDTKEVTKEMTLAFHKIVSVNGLGVLYNFEDAVREMLEQAPAVEPAQAVPVTIVKQIDALSTHAYCEFINQLKQDVCLGVEYKMEKGKFGKAELAAHENAKQWWGRHMAYSEVLKILGTLNTLHPVSLDSDTRAMIWDVSHLAVLDQSVMTADERKKHINELAKICDKLRERLEAGQ